MADLLQIENIRKTFPGVIALDDVSFSVANGEIHTLLGENGAGKSTLLQAIEGQLPIESGSIRLDGVPLTLALARQQLALMPQRGEIAWHFPINVRELVALGRMAAKLGLAVVPPTVGAVAWARPASSVLDGVYGCACA